MPQPGDVLVTSYRLSGSADETPRLYPNPQVLCSGLGAGTSSNTLTSLATCVIPAGFLAAGDRLEIRFDLEHSGTSGGFSFETHWGAAGILARNASASDALVTVRADAALTTAGAQLSHQSWGTSLTFAAGVGKAAGNYAAGITLDFLASAANPADTVTLTNFTVLRHP